MAHLVLGMGVDLGEKGSRARTTVKHNLANARPKVGAETTAQLVWILAPRLPEPEGGSGTDE